MVKYIERCGDYECIYEADTTDKLIKLSKSFNENNIIMELQEQNLQVL